MRNKSIVISFLFFWVLHLVLPDFLFQFEKNQIRKAHFDSENNIKIKKLTYHFDDFNTLNWQVKGKEFSLNGKLYDVLSINKCKNKYEISCFSDTEEDTITLIYHKLLKKKRKNSRSQNHNVKKNCLSEQLINTSLVNDFKQSEQSLWANLDLYYKGNVLEIIPPPPKVLFF